MWSINSTGFIDGLMDENNFPGVVLCCCHSSYKGHVMFKMMGSAVLSGSLLCRTRLDVNTEFAEL